MGVLEQVTNMKSQGMSEPEISRILREQGVSPKQIVDALGQSQIKNAVSNERNLYGTDGMQPSIMPRGEEFEAPKPLERKPIPTGNSIPQAQYNSRTNYEPEEEYPEPYSPQQYEYSPQYQPQSFDSQGYDTDTMIDIAEQVFEERVAELQKQMENINELKTLTQGRVEHLTKRLEKIETIIDKLQIAILKKIGSYGENLDSIKNEMSMMQDSFSKIAEHQINKPHYTAHNSSSPKTKSRKK